MFDLWNNRFSLRTLWCIAMGKAFLRYRNPRRRAVDRHRVEFYERAWRDAAGEIGATFDKVGGNICEIGLDGIKTRVDIAMSAIDDPVTLEILSDKLLTYKLLAREGLSIPRHVAYKFADPSPAIDFLAKHSTGCVVKPASGTGGGRGITAHVKSRLQLARASAVAGVYNDQLLIEEQIPGDNYRLLYLDGELVDAFVRRAPSVIGDGKSSVAQLVSQANDDRLKSGAGRSQTLLTIDLDLRRTLAEQGLSFSSIPNAEQHVILKTVVNENCGDDNITVTSELCTSIIEDGASACRALGVRLAGVDIITEDCTKPLAENGGVILEVNAPPNLYYHYHKRDGVFSAAVPILRAIFGAPVKAEVAVGQ